jgi:hypothetical protein
MSMTRTVCLGLLAAMTIASTLAAGTTVFAKTARTKVAAAHDVGQVTPIKATPIVDSCRGTFVCRQDLFDRNNPNNLRSDWPGPPAQPAQF